MTFRRLKKQSTKMILIIISIVTLIQPVTIQSGFAFNYYDVLDNEINYEYDFDDEYDNEEIYYDVNDENYNDEETHYPDEETYHENDYPNYEGEEDEQYYDSSYYDNYYDIDEDLGIEMMGAHIITNLLQTGVTDRNTAFRTGPGTNYNLIRTVNGSTNVRITGRTGIWYRVNINGEIGFMRQTHVSRTRQFAVVATNNAHVREGRGTSHRSLTRVAAGTRVTVARRAASWSRITVNGHTGWIRNSDLYVENARRPYHTNVNNVRVHTRPRAAATVRYRLPRNTDVMVVQRTTNGWSQIRFEHEDGTLTGWVRTNQITRQNQPRRLIRNGVLRTGPGSGYDRIRSVPNNTRVMTLARVGTWYRVRFTVNGVRQYGWLHRNNFARNVLPPNIGAAGFNPTWGTTAGRTPVRAGRGTSYRTLTTLNDGTLVGNIVRRSGDWLEVHLPARYGSHRGWVHHDNMRIETHTAIVRTHSGRINEATSLRRGAGTSHAVIRELNLNATVSVLQQSGNWLRVSIGSDEGWVQEQFVNTTTAATTNISTQLRSGPGTNYSATRRVPAGVNFTIIRQQGLWYEIRLDSRTDWIHSQDVNVRLNNGGMANVTNRVGTTITTTGITGVNNLNIIVPTRRTIRAASSFDILDGIRVEFTNANGTITNIPISWHQASWSWRFTHNNTTFTVDVDGVMDNMTPGTYEREVVVRRGNTIVARANQTIVIR